MPGIFSHSPFFGFLGYHHIPRYPYPYLWRAWVLAPVDRHTRGQSGIYLERGSVHVCTLLCTGGYTDVYTRVHFSLLGSRYTLGKFAPR